MTTNNKKKPFKTKWNNFIFNTFFNGYCFFCNIFGHKVSTCRFMVSKLPRFGNKQFLGFSNMIRCFKCNMIGHTSRQCKQSKTASEKVWRPNQVQNIEQSLLVQTALLSNKKILWVVDSGCSNHMTRDKEKFVKLEDYASGFVKFGDNSGIQIKGRGSLILNNNTPIHDVYYVERLKHNLLSVSQICDSGYNISFNSQGCTIITNYGKIVASGLRTHENI